MLGSKSKWAVAALAAALTVVGAGVAAVPARAVDGDLFVDGCLARAAIPTCPGGLPGLPLGMATSPDGRQVYVAMRANDGASFDGLQIFDRSSRGVAVRRTGAAGCVAPPGSPGGCTALPQATSMAAAYDVAVAPDGRNVYVVAYDGSLLNFARSTTSGSVGFVNCLGNGTGCATMTTSAVPRSVAVSPDSRHVYVKTSNGLAVLNRNDSTRRVAQKLGLDGCFTEEAISLACDEVDGLHGNSYGMEVSRDGRHVYVAFHSPGGVSVFNRAQDGRLSQSTGQAGGCVSANGNSAEALKCQDGNDYLSNTHVTTVSPDGRSVYVGGQYGLFAYRRNATTGYLTEIGCFGEGPGCTAVPAGLSHVFDLAVTRDGRELVVAAYNSRSAVSFRRNPTTGALTPRAGKRGCLSAVVPSCLSMPLLHNDYISRLALDPSGTRFYLASGSGMLATITRDYAPVCRSTTVGVPFNTAISIPLSCADANGDAMTLQKGRTPAKGQIGEIIAGAVFYSPFANYIGPDTFQYRARTPARSVNGPYATISVSVAAPPPPDPPIVNPAGVDNDRDGFFAGQDCNDNDAAIRPGAPEVKGDNLDENCDGTAEPFPTLTSGVGNKWDVRGRSLRLTVLQVTQQFPTGWKAQIRCSGKPKCTFRTKSLKAGKVRRGAASIISSLSKRQRRFKAGQTVEVWVSAPGFNTKVSRWVLRAGKIPTTQPFCVLPGQTRAQKTCT